MCVCVCVSVCYRYTQIVHQKCSWPKCIKMPYHKILEHIFLGEKTHAIPTKYTNLPTPLSYHDLWHFCGISLAISPPEEPTPTASCTWKLQVVALCCHRCSRNLRVNRGLDERRNIFFFPRRWRCHLNLQLEASSWIVFSLWLVTHHILWPSYLWTKILKHPVLIATKLMLHDDVGKYHPRALLSKQLRHSCP